MSQTDKRAVQTIHAILMDRFPLTFPKGRVGGGARRLTSVRRSNWTCSFPASSFRKGALLVRC